MKLTYKFSLLLLFYFSLISSVFSQSFQKGLSFDDEAYSQTPKKARLVARGYENIPSSASLKKYCPTPGRQIGSTCTGWATAWAARTILESKFFNRTDPQTIDQHTFSPYFIYSSIKSNDDLSCNKGAIISDAFLKMKEVGVPYFKDFDEVCSTDIPSNVHDKAYENRILDFARLFDYYDDKNYRISSVKKALAEERPVVIGMKAPDSFDKVKNDLWDPVEDPEGFHPGHAMCVIGYDDTKYGGAFEIMNSWGKTWGNNGFVWIKYDDFADFGRYAYEMVSIPDKPQPTPEVLAEVEDIKEIEDVEDEFIQFFDLSGSIRLVLSNEKEMPTRLKEYSERGLRIVRNDDSDVEEEEDDNINPNQTVHKPFTKVYKTKRGYSSGTRFRMYIKNSEPAFVYMLGSDATEKVSVLFPFSDEISPVLDYSDSEIAIPDESHFVEMDNTVGTDILCVLYSKKPLNIHEIQSKLENENGLFIEKLNNVLKDQIVNEDQIVFEKDEIHFTGISGNASIIPLIVEIEHKY